MAFHGLFHASSELRKEPAGAVQDFCPICRGLRTFTLTNFFMERSMRVMMLVKIAGSRDGGIGVAECRECRSAWRTVDGIASRGRKGSEDVRRQLEERLALEEKVKSRSTTPEERSWLLLEPLHRMASMATVHQATGKPDPVASWGCFATVLGMFGWAAAIGITAVQSGKKIEKAEDWMTIPLVFLHLCGAAVAYAWVTRKRRYVRRELETRVARSVEAIGPSKHEMIAAVEEFQRLEPEAGKPFDGGRIHDKMRGVIN